MKNILLLVHDDRGQEARLQAALDLTRALEGHLTCLDVSMAPFTSGDYYGSPGAALIALGEEHRESKNKAAIETRLGHEDVPWTWIDAMGDPADCIDNAARLADLIVLSLTLESDSIPDMGNIVSRVLMHTRTPILAVPETLRRFDLGRVLIAWDGGKTVVTTMRACVPLLKLATQVRLLTVIDPREVIDTEQAAEYLSRHGIQTNVQLIEPERHPIAALIEGQCAAWHADYLLMGACGHGRIAETFGGITKKFLAHSKTPVLLSH